MFYLLKRPGSTPRPKEKEKAATAETAETRGFWSMGRRFTAMFILALVAGFGPMLWFSADTAREQMMELARKSDTTVSSLIADRAAGGLRWERKEAIEEAYAGFVNAEGSGIASLVTFDKSGKPITEYKSTKLPGHDLSQALVKAKTALAQGKTSVEVADRHLIVTVPVVQGKERDRVGTMAIAWSTDALKGSLARAQMNTLGIAAAVTLAILVLILLLFHRLVEKPLKMVTSVMSRIVAGELEIVIPGRHRRDDIGVMARMVEVFRNNGEDLNRMAKERERADAEKEETDRLAAEQEKRATEERRNALLSLADQFETNVKSVVDSVSASSTEMRATAQAMSATAEETSRQSTMVAAASEQATSNVQTVASAAEELSASVTEISNQVAQSTKIAQNAVEQAEHTNAEIQELATAARKIDKVVSLISDIAAQTNLLALNATIEAARAGDAGKGFAVVASEVKSLAKQTAQATEEITAQIAAVQGATTNAVSAIGDITKVIGEINSISTSIAAAIEEQGAATKEIARNVQEAATGTREVSSNISGVTRAAAETGTSAQHVLEAATDLSKQSETLGSEVDKFLRQVRAM